MHHPFRALLLSAMSCVINALIVSASEPAAQSRLGNGLYAVWHTVRGDITAEIFFEKTPLTAASFVGLAEGTIPFEAEGREPGKPYFDGLTFHRVVPGFVAQGGDPLGTGEGDPGYRFRDEFSPELKHDSAGMLAMANAGPNTNGSQFYFTLAPVNRLNYKHTVFGRVVSGIDALLAIEQDDTIDHVEIVRIGPKAERFRPDAASFAALRESARAIEPRDPALPPLFQDAAGLELPEGFPDWLNEKLHHYRIITGNAVWVRCLPKLTAEMPVSASGEAATSNPLRALHDSLAGVNPRAATIVFVADENRWRLWLGDGLVQLFGIAPDRLGDEAQRKRLHALKQELLAEAKSKLETDPIRRAVDAAVTGVIEALDRATRSGIETP